jgi:hypothetical protein
LGEAEENKEIIQETNPDKLVKGTFQMGLGDAEKRARDNVLLPHMELIKYGEDSDSDEDEVLGIGRFFGSDEIR